MTQKISKLFDLIDPGELQVLQGYPFDWRDANGIFLGNNGGFSGAALWKIQLPDQEQFCFRRWPSLSSADQIHLIHRVLFHAKENGFPKEILPLPFMNRRGDSFLSFLKNRNYELTSWLAGEADFHDNPSVERVENAAKTLAIFHDSTKQMKPYPKRAESLPGVQKRIAFINQLNHGLLARIQSHNHTGEFAGLLGRLVDLYKQLWPRFLEELNKAACVEFAQQICIKDIWHDHLLWTGDQVSGLIDFGAIGFDNVAIDISRLFGSLFQNDWSQWKTGLNAYQSVRELSKAERKLIEVYDRSTTMLAGMNWLKWILVENRKFEEHLPIIERMEKLTNRLREWV